MRQTEQYLINKIFSVPYIDKLVMTHSISGAFEKCITRYVKEENMTCGNAISHIYEYMNEDYRNEYYYKNTLFNELLIRKHNLYDTAALTELPIGNSKADFIMINGKGMVYEIKTDLDTFARLESQIENYYKVFSYVNVVVGSKQLSKAKHILKDTNVGIIQLCDSGKLICRKKSKYCRQYLSHEAMFNVLRKQEYEKILLKYYGELPQVNNFEYYRECMKWVKNINIITVQKNVMECLKSRTVLTVETNIDMIPNELKFYIYFSKRYRLDCNKVNMFLEEEVRR